MNLDLLLEREAIVNQLKEIAKLCIETAKNDVSTVDKRKLPFLKCAVYTLSTLLKAVSQAENAVILTRIEELERRLAR